LNTGHATCAGGRASVFETVYFGGGSPALCDLTPLFEVLKPLLASSVEFTVELHPLDVTDRYWSSLRVAA